MTSAQESLAFFRRLQQLSNKIHATHDIDGITPALSDQLCDLFACDRLTVYQLSGDGASLVSRIKTGLAAFKPLKLPVSKHSIAGYAVLSGRALNLRDVYDDEELRRVDPDLCHQHGVDRRTGYRAREMLVAPITDGGGAVRGALQLINNRHGGPFDALVEEGVQHICDALAIAMLPVAAAGAAGPAAGSAAGSAAGPAAPPVEGHAASADAVHALPGEIAATIEQIMHLASQGVLTELQLATTPTADGDLRFAVTGVLRLRD